MVRASIGADPYRVGAMIVRAINQQAANAGCAHFPEGDFLLACRWGRFGHAPRSPLSSNLGMSLARLNPPEFKRPGHGNTNAAKRSYSAQAALCVLRVDRTKRARR